MDLQLTGKHIKQYSGRELNSTNQLEHQKVVHYKKKTNVRLFHKLQNSDI